MANIRDLKKDINYVLGDIIEAVTIWELTNPSKDNKKAESIIDEAIDITNKDIASHLKLPPVKLHCSMLAEDAIRAAVKDFKSKNEA